MTHVTFLEQLRQWIFILDIFKIYASICQTIKSFVVTICPVDPRLAPKNTDPNPSHVNSSSSHVGYRCDLYSSNQRSHPLTTLLQDKLSLIDMHPLHVSSKLSPSRLLVRLAFIEPKTSPFNNFHTWQVVTD